MKWIEKKITTRLYIDYSETKEKLSERLTIFSGIAGPVASITDIFVRIYLKNTCETSVGLTLKYIRQRETLTSIYFKGLAKIYEYFCPTE